MFDVRSSAIVFLGTLCGVLSYYYHDEQRPIYVTASVGDYVVFNCDLDFPQSIPIPYKLLWRKEGDTIFTFYEGVSTATEPYVGRIHLLDSGHHYSYDKASVNLTSIRESDAGWYECKVIFPNRTPSSRNNGTWFHLSVNGGNILAIPPINQTVLEGEEAELICLPKDSSIRIVWYKNGIPVREYQDLVHRSVMTAEGTLRIKPTDMTDYGEYECEAENDVGDRQNAKAFLNVQYKAKVIYAPAEIQLPYGKSAIIDCHFRANPPLTYLRWEKDGFLYDPYNIQGVFYRKNGSLLISKVDETHNGYYTCTPFNELGTQGPSTTMHVIVQRSPIFVVTPQNVYIKKLGDSLEIPCDARDGNNGHKPIVVWYKKDGTDFPTGRYEIRGGNLSIVNIQEEDRGLYVCSASNKAATITAEVELLVENIPSSSPYNLTAVVLGTDVYLRWQAGRQRSDVTYSIWYKPVGQLEWKMHQVPPTSFMETTIYNLEPEQEYEFMVLCKDHQGDGLFSKSIRAWTSSSSYDHQPVTPSITLRKNGMLPPVGYPRNVTVYPTYTGYLVNWQPPEYGLENLKHYIVRWTQEPDNFIYRSMETRNTSFLIMDLVEGFEYNVQVISLSYDDQQAVSEGVKIKVPGYKRIQAVSTGIISGLALLVIIFIVVYYAKKKWFISEEKICDTKIKPSS